MSADSKAENTLPAESGPSYSLGQMIACMLRLGTIGFGGPVALAGYMHRDLVDTHPYPEQRFRANHPRQEPCAVIPLAGICAGGRG